jgi:hypothetical protein
MTVNPVRESRHGQNRPFPLHDFFFPFPIIAFSLYNRCRALPLRHPAKQSLLRLLRDNRHNPGPLLLVLLRILLHLLRRDGLEQPHESLHLALGLHRRRDTQDEHRIHECRLLEPDLGEFPGLSREQPLQDRPLEQVEKRGKRLRRPLGHNRPLPDREPGEPLLAAGSGDRRGHLQHGGRGRPPVDALVLPDDGLGRRPVHRPARAHTGPRAPERGAQGPRIPPTLQALLLGPLRHRGDRRSAPGRRDLLLPRAERGRPPQQARSSIFALDGAGRQAYPFAARRLPRREPTTRPS